MGQASAITWSYVLEQLRRSDTQITDYGQPVGAFLFDPHLHAGKSQPVAAHVLTFLSGQGWIQTADEGRIRRFTISAAGIARLNAMTSATGR